MVLFHVIICRSNVCLSSVPPPSRISDTIGAHLMFFRVDSVTLNIPHTTEKSDTIIFRSTKIIGTLPRIVRRGEIGPIILWCVPSLSNEGNRKYQPEEKKLTFSRSFYKKATNRLYIYCQYVCFLGIEPTTFCTANSMLYH